MADHKRTSAPTKDDDQVRLRQDLTRGPTPSRSLSAGAMPIQSTPAAAWGSASVVALQRLIGNQAIQREMKSSVQANPTQRKGAANRPPGNRKSPVAPYAQRRSVTAGWFKKAVKFKLDNISATLPAGLLTVANGANFFMESQPYNATGTVTATGPAAQIAKYDLGFLQTVFRSTRNFKYSPLNHQRSLKERILPSIFGERHRYTDTTGLLPVRDGDTGVKPWYETNDVAPFGAGSPDTQTTTLFDQPGTESEFEKTVNGTTQYLVRTNGLDSFRTWLIIRKRSASSGSYRRLGYIDWKVNYKNQITPNPANPSAAAIAPNGNAGGVITKTVKGPGVYLPLTGDAAANDKAFDKESNW